MTLEANPGRAALACELGANHVLTRLDEMPKNAYDVVIDATGAMGLLESRAPGVRKVIIQPNL